MKSRLRNISPMNKLVPFFHWIYMAIQLKVFYLPSAIEAEKMFCEQIDPRNYFQPYAVQCNYYKRRPQELNDRIIWAQQMLCNYGNQFIKTHSSSICPKALNGRVRKCSANCRFVHHLPLSIAIKQIVGAPPGFPAIDNSPQPMIAEETLPSPYPSPFLPKPLIIDQEIPQPIQKLNEEADQEAHKEVQRIFAKAKEESNQLKINPFP